MIRTLLLFNFLLVSLCLNAQRFDWVSFTPFINDSPFSGSGGLAISADDEANLYTVATFFAPIQVGNDTIQLSGNNLLLTKWSHNGEALAYKVISSTGNQVHAFSLAYDEVNGHIILSSNVAGTIDIIGDTVFSGNGAAGQLIRFDTQLVYQSNVGLGNTYNSPIVAKDGFVYSANNYDSQIKKFDSNNQLVWNVALSSGSFNISSIYMSEQDTLYVIGHIMGNGIFSNPVTYGEVTISAPDAGNNNHVGIFKLDTAGTVIGGTYLCQGNSYLNKLCVTADEQGNVFAAVPYYLADQVIGSDTLGTVTGGSDALVVKLNSNLEAQWVEELHHSGGNMETNGIKVQSSGNIFVMGLYGGNATFGSTTLATAQFGSGYLAHLENETGTILYATNFGSLVGTGRPLDVVNIGDEYIISGLSYGTSLTGGQYGCYEETYSNQYITLYNDTAFQTPSVALEYSAPALNALSNVTDSTFQWFLNDVELEGEIGNSIIPVDTGTYVVIVNYFGCSDSDTLAISNIINTGIEQVIEDNAFIVYPNPSSGSFNLKIIGTLTSEYSIEIYNLTGEIVYWEKTNSSSTQIDLSNNTKGLYFYKIKSKDQIMACGKIVVN